MYTDEIICFYFYLVNESFPDHGEEVRIAKLSTDTFICPWGSKIHIGVEDLRLNVKYNINSMNNTFDSTKRFPGGTKDFSDKMIMERFKIKMQLLCAAGIPFSYKNEEADSTLQWYTLLEMRNNELVHSENGKTLTINMPTLITKHLGSYRCLHDEIKIHTWLVGEKPRFKGRVDSKDLASTKTNTSTQNHYAIKIVGYTFRMKFRMNYIVF